MSDSNDDAYIKALTHMQRLCSQREYCVSDIEFKLRRYEFGKGEVKRIIDSLINDKFTDDARYARAFVRDKTTLNGWGPVKVRMALRLKKIDDNIIDELIAGIPEDSLREKLTSLLNSKLRSLSNESNMGVLKGKLLRFALSRGFEYGVANDVLGNILNDYKTDKN